MNRLMMQSLLLNHQCPVLEREYKERELGSHSVLLYMRPPTGVVPVGGRVYVTATSYGDLHSSSCCCKFQAYLYGTSDSKTFVTTCLHVPLTWYWYTVLTVI